MLAVASAAYTTAVAVLLNQFVGTPSEDQSAQLAQRAEAEAIGRRNAIESMPPKLEHPTLPLLADDDPGVGLKESLLQASEHESPVIQGTSCGRASCSWEAIGGAGMVGLAWVVMVALLAAPIVIYIVKFSLPENNTLPEWLREELVAQLLTSCLALYLSLMSSALIPAVTCRAASVMLGQLRSPNPAEAGVELDAHALSTVMGIIARTATTVVIPMAAAIYFNDSCARGWTGLWEPCDTSDFFTIKESVPYLLWLDYYYKPRPIYATLELTLLEHGSICPSSAGYDWTRGTCAQGIIELLGPLFLQKLCYAVLFAAGSFVVAELVPKLRSQLQATWSTIKRVLHGVGVVVAELASALRLQLQTTWSTIKHALCGEQDEARAPHQQEPEGAPSLGLGDAAPGDAAAWQPLQQQDEEDETLSHETEALRSLGFHGTPGDDAGARPQQQEAAEAPPSPCLEEDEAKEDEDDDAERGAVDVGGDDSRPTGPSAEEPQGRYNQVVSWAKQKWHAMMAPTEPDPMMALIWLETALVFGAQVPLLLPLLALQLTLDAHLYDFKLDRVPPHTRIGLPILVSAMRCHAVAVLALAAAFNIFVFVDLDTRLEIVGPGILVATASLLVLGAFLAVQLATAFPESWNRIKQGARDAVAACGHWG